MSQSEGREIGNLNYLPDTEKEDNININSLNMDGNTKNVTTRSPSKERELERVFGVTSHRRSNSGPKHLSPNQINNINNVVTNIHIPSAGSILNGESNNDTSLKKSRLSRKSSSNNNLSQSTQLPPSIPQSLTSSPHPGNQHSTNIQTGNDSSTTGNYGSSSQVTFGRIIKSYLSHATERAESQENLTNHEKEFLRRERSRQKQFNKSSTSNFTDSVTGDEMGFLGKGSAYEESLTNQITGSGTGSNKNNPANSKTVKIKINEQNKNKTKNRRNHHDSGSSAQSSSTTTTTGTFGTISYTSGSTETTPSTLDVSEGAATLTFTTTTKNNNNRTGSNRSTTARYEALKEGSEFCGVVVGSFM